VAGLTRGNYTDINVDADFLSMLARQSKDAADYMRNAAKSASHVRRHENWHISEIERERVNSEVRQIKAHSERIAGFLDSLGSQLETASADFNSTQSEIITKMKSIAYTVD